MREYEIKRKHFPNVDGKLYDIMKKSFGNVSKEGDYFVSSYKALESISAKLDGKKIIVETKTKKASNEDSLDAIKRYNEFLEKVTGMTAKQRKKKLAKL